MIGGVRRMFRACRLAALIGAAILLMHSTSAHAACTSPAAPEGTMMFNKDSSILQFCDGIGWKAYGAVAVGGLDPCNPSNSPAAGQLCGDGSKYVGLSPDGNIPMYTTPADAGQLTWNDGSPSAGDLAMQNCGAAQASCRTGEANTALLVGLGTSPSPAPYVAARHCDALAAQGKNDWYLPAQDELDLMYDNRSAIGGFNTSGIHPAGYYWSSSEASGGVTRAILFSDGTLNGLNRDDPVSVRCVRRDYIVGGGGGGGIGCTNPAAAEGAVVYNRDSKVPQYCRAGTWIALATPSSVYDPCDPANSPAPGQLCNDGTKYAGLSPDGNIAMYTTPADAGQFTWNDGSTTYVDTAMQNCDLPTFSLTSCWSGAANTVLLAGLGSASPAPYDAAVHCDNLVAHGRTDWYLPASSELVVLRDNKGAIGGFNLGGGFNTGRYWSSSEYSDSSAIDLRFSDTRIDPITKENGKVVRCVRKGFLAGGSGGCSSPIGTEGMILYNNDANIHQFCDGSNWRAFELARP